MVDCQRLAATAQHGCRSRQFVSRDATYEPCILRECTMSAFGYETLINPFPRGINKVP